MRAALLVDFILVPAGFRVLRYEVLDEKIASDHRPLMGVFNYSDPGKN